MKARYLGVCRGCGAYTQPRNGKGEYYFVQNFARPQSDLKTTTFELVSSAPRADRVHRILRARRRETAAAGGAEKKNLCRRNRQATRGKP